MMWFTLTPWSLAICRLILHEPSSAPESVIKVRVMWQFMTKYFESGMNLWLCYFRETWHNLSHLYNEVYSLEGKDGGCCSYICCVKWKTHIFFYTYLTAKMMRGIAVCREWIEFLLLCKVSFLEIHLGKNVVILYLIVLICRQRSMSSARESGCMHISFWNINQSQPFMVLLWWDKMDFTFHLV